MVWYFGSVYVLSDVCAHSMVVCMSCCVCDELCGVTCVWVWVGVIRPCMYGGLSGM